MKTRKIGFLAVGCLLMSLCACSVAKRAIVNEKDLGKIFPWNRNKSTQVISVKPKTTWVKMFPFAGSYQEVKVNIDTTFYLTDSSGINFAYTPSISPYRRLSKVEYAEIQWPLAAALPVDDSSSVESQIQTGTDKPKSKKKKRRNAD